MSNWRCNHTELNVLMMLLSLFFSVNQKLQWINKVKAYINNVDLFIKYLHCSYVVIMKHSTKMINRLSYSNHNQMIFSENSEKPGKKSLFEINRFCNRSHFFYSFSKNMIPTCFTNMQSFNLIGTLTKHTLENK